MTGNPRSMIECDDARYQIDDRPWAAYLRLSKLEAADVRGVSKAERQRLTMIKLKGQEDDIRQWARAHGITIGRVYIDPGLSASKRNVKRPGWDEVMKDATSGMYAGVVQVAIDRFTRDPREMEDLIDLAEKHHVSVAGVRNGLFDLNTANGRREARGAATQAAAESDIMSERIMATMHRKMKAGQPMGGGRSFGFENGGMIQRPDEVEVIRDVVARLLKGEPAAHVAKLLDGQGWRTVRGNHWNQSVLIKMVGAPRYGGHVVLKGKIVGTIPGEPVLDTDTYQALQALINSRRAGRKPQANRFPLTGLLTCGRCGHLMNGATRDSSRGYGTGDSREYRCPPNLGGCSMSILAHRVEAEVEKHMINVLATPEIAAEVMAENSMITEQRDGLIKRLEANEKKRVNLTAKWTRGWLPDEPYEADMGFLIHEREVLEAQLPAVTPDATTTDLDPALAARVWGVWTHDERRAAIKRFHVKITIAPVKKHGNVFDPSRVVCTKPVKRRRAQRTA